MRPAVVACALPAAALASQSLRAEPWEEAGLRLAVVYSHVRPVSPPCPASAGLGTWNCPRLLSALWAQKRLPTRQPPSPRVMRAAESSFPASF